VRTSLLWIARRGRVLAPGDPSPRRIARTINVVDCRIPGHRTCLVRSMTCETLLGWHGHIPTHRLGVDPDSDDGFVAHSWLEYEGDILIGDEDVDRYEPLPPLNRSEDDL
jgi:hypothetical protein